MINYPEILSSQLYTGRELVDYLVTDLFFQMQFDPSLYVPSQSYVQE